MSSNAQTRNSGMPLQRSALEPLTAATTVSALELELVRKAIAERYGFWVNDSWSGQLANRLAARVAATGRAGLGDYISRLNGPGADLAELTQLVESMLNGETHFWRTEPHFDALRDLVVASWRATRSAGQRLRIASLGCSTGEEPYTIAIVLHETLTPAELEEVEISAVDVNSRSLATARAGLYGPSQLRELSPARRERWFTPERGQWRVLPELSSRVRFLQHNLMHPLPFSGLDAVFCRNVMIYFKPPVVAACMRELHAALRPGGYLFLGHAESAFGFPEWFEPVPVRDSVLYQAKFCGSFAL